MFATDPIWCTVVKREEEKMEGKARPAILVQVLPNSRGATSKLPAAI